MYFRDLLGSDFLFGVLEAFLVAFMNDLDLGVEN